MTKALSIIIALVAAIQSGVPQPDHIRLAPPTGVYIETDQDTEQPDVRYDWYASASELAATHLQHFASPTLSEITHCISAPMAA